MATVVKKAAPAADKNATKKKLKKITSPKVLVKVNSTYNNTIVTITDYTGEVISSASCGSLEFK